MATHRTSLTLKGGAFIALILLILLAVGYSSPAFAAPSAWKSIDVSLYADQQQLMLVSATLPEETPLPYEGELAVPAGARFQWIGEILGGDPSKDPTVPYVKRTEGDVDIYSFTLTKSREAQIEVTVTGMSLSKGGTNTTALRWKAWTDVPTVRVAERLPTGSELVESAEGAKLEPAGGGYSYYTKTQQNVKAGDVVELAFSYKPAAAASAGPGTTASRGTATPATAPLPSGTTILTVILAALLVVVAVGWFRASRTGTVVTVEVPPTPKAETTEAAQKTAAAKSAAKKANAGATAAPIAPTARTSGATARKTAAGPDTGDTFFDDDEPGETTKPARRRR